ncbi:DUF6338 family protein [Halorussus caseinilyticus]|uniref:DUF6338 family protein n=1 Tax=Halorussus caseinilyticus TaxID=3034025 RepID=UPI0023E7E052|nr:DUF6338 family protein [Halorussus sp. DT72]
MPITAETLILAALLIAPGFIAVLLGITLGVVEQKIDRDIFYLTSFVSSILIDITFIWIGQQTGKIINSQNAIRGVFFGPDRFYIESAVTLFILSCAFGLVYAITLTTNFPHQVRSKLGSWMSHQRNPWQPWEGGLRNAEQVMVELKNGKDISGILTEYSRVGRERQLVLAYPVYIDFEDKPSREKTILTEEQIRAVHVMTTREREGILDKIKYFLSNFQFCSCDESSE